MHPRNAVLMAYSDAEADAGRRRRIADHLRKCEGCRNKLQCIRREKDSISSFADTAEGAAPVMDIEPGLAAVLSAIAAWKDGRIGGMAPRVRSRVRDQMEMYFGCGTASLIDRPGTRADELLAKAQELADAFLGRNAADALRDDALHGLDCVGLKTEAAR